MNKTSRHHILAQSLFQDYNVHCSENIIRLSDPIHVALHRLFDNATPKEQLELIHSINSQVYSKEVEKIFREVLNIDESKRYKDLLIRK